LNLSHNDIGEWGAIQIIEALKNHSNLISLNFSHNHIGDYEAIFMIQQLKNLRSIDISYNQISCHEIINMIEIAQALQDHPNLISINISQNPILNKNDRLNAIKKALSKNINAPSLNTSDNRSKSITIDQAYPHEIFFAGTDQQIGIQSNPELKENFQNLTINLSNNQI